MVGWHTRLTNKRARVIIVPGAARPYYLNSNKVREINTHVRDVMQLERLYQYVYVRDVTREVVPSLFQNVVCGVWCMVWSVTV